MPTSSDAPRSTTSRKFMKLGLTIVAAIAVYTIGWYIAADQLKTTILASIENETTTAPKIACAEPATHGYPFRIGVFCSGLQIDDMQNGLSATFGPFRSAAQVYNPSRIVWELDGPGQIRSALGLTGSAEWSLLHASTRTADSGLQASSLEVKDLKASLTETVSGQTFDVVASRGETHLRRNEANLEIAMLLENVTGTARGLTQALPPVSASVDLVVADRATILNGTSDYRTALYGASGELRRFVADLGEGRVITFSGPYSIGDDGLISGEFNLTIEKLSAWNTTIGTALPEMQSLANAATSILRSLAKGADTSSARIVVQNGVVMLSFIPIGTLPPL